MELSEEQVSPIIEKSVRKVLAEKGIDCDTIAEKIVDKLRYKGLEIEIVYKIGSLQINGKKIPIIGHREKMICEVIFVSPIKYKTWSWDEMVKAADYSGRI